MNDSQTKLARFSVAGRKSFLKTFLLKSFTEIIEQRERWILWIPVAMGIGIGIYFSLLAEPEYWLGGAYLLSSLFIGYIGYHLKYVPLVMIGIICGFVALGFSVSQFRTLRVAAPVLEKELGPVMVQGIVQDIDRLPKAFRITLLNSEIERLPEDNTPYKIRIKMSNKNPIPELGDKVQILSVLKPPSPPVSPGAFDFQRYSYFMRLGAMGYAVGTLKVLEQGDSKSLSMEAVRQSMGKRVFDSMQDDQLAAIGTALLTGERHRITEENWEKIRNAGIAHLLAISGLHIGLVAGLIFFFVRAILAAIEPIALRYQIKKISAFIALAGAFFYMTVVGAPLSAQRATLMISVVMLAIMLDREAFSMRLAAFAAIVVLLWAPESLFGASFQMSFAAVVGLIAFYEGISRYWRKGGYNAGFINKFWVYFAGSMLTTIVATLATAPFSLFHFQYITLLPSLFANLVAVPLAAFWVMPMGVMAYILMPFGLETIPLQIMEQGIGLIMITVEKAVSFESGIYNVEAWPMRALICFSFGGLWLALWLGRIRWIGVIFIVLGGVFVVTAPQPDILISASGKIMAVRHEDGHLSFSKNRSEKFIRNAWNRLAGSQKPEYWPKWGVSEDKSLRCDDKACLFSIKNKRVSFITDPVAFEDDCNNVDLIISPDYPVPKWCKADFDIDRFNLYYDGAHAVYLFEPAKGQKSKGIQITNVKKSRGQRPWTD